MVIRKKNKKVSSWEDDYKMKVAAERREEELLEKQRQKEKKKRVKAFLDQFYLPESRKVSSDTLAKFFESYKHENKWIFHNTVYYMEIIKNVHIRFGMFRNDSGSSGRSIGMDTSDKILFKLNIRDKDYKLDQILHLNHQPLLDLKGYGNAMLTCYLKNTPLDKLGIIPSILINFNYTHFYTMNQSIIDIFRNNSDLNY